MASDGVKKKDDRIRNFACMVYPESAPKNWESILSMYHIPAFISPLHENDIDPQNQPKKPHYHVMLMFDGKKSDSQVQELFDGIGGVGFERVQNIRAYARYLCHLDNPDKAQYNPEDVINVSGADYMFIIGLAQDKYKAIGEMMDFCEDQDIVSFYQLCRYARIYRYDWFKMLCDNSAFYMREFLQSRGWSVSNNHTEFIDKSTGEVLF